MYNFPSGTSKSEVHRDSSGGSADAGAHFCEGVVCDHTQQGIHFSEESFGENDDVVSLKVVLIIE